MAALNEADLQVKYNKAKRLLDSVDCLKRNKLKVETLQRASKNFKELGDYQDSESLAKKCDELANQYASASETLPPPPKNPLETKDHSKTFTIMVRVVAVAIILLILSAFVYLRQTDHGCYLRSSFYEAIGKHEKAYKMFLHIKDYRDSEKRYLVNRYKHACDQLKEKHYYDARDAFRDIKDYKNSGEKLAEAEIAILKDLKKNDDVLFGEAHWIVAEKEKDRVFLVKTKPINGIPYNETRKKVTWKSSTVRQYLNDDKKGFLKETFTEEMINSIINTKVVVRDNEKYKTKGSTSIDKVFMLNDKQAEEYTKRGENLAKKKKKDPYNLFKRDYWLIGPGETQSEAQFVSFGEIMEMGYPVTDSNINIRPCMWVSTK